MIKRVIASICMICLVISQICLIMPEKVDASEPANSLEIRVGYFGDDSDYRTKVILSNSEMESLVQKTYRYVNMTRVGTLMSTIARGPTLEDVLDKAGIDVGSIRMLHLRTNDENSKPNNWFIDFPASKYIGITLYYYPNLLDHWESKTYGEGTPSPGALNGARKVDTIIAVKCKTTKSISEGKNLKETDMRIDERYRLCAGQAPLKEGVATSAFSSHESAKWIFGIDVTLWGTPGEATGLSLKLKDKDIKVGSTKRVVAKIKGQELFQDKVNKKLKWSSSDKSIATVDKKGNVTVKKKGKVTITARTENGIKKSIVINGTDSSEDNTEKKVDLPNDKPLDKEPKKAVGVGNVLGIEVSLGEKVSDGIVEVRPDMPEDTVELPKEDADPRVMFYAGICALVILLLGVIIRIQYYRREV